MSIRLAFALGLLPKKASGLEVSSPSCHDIGIILRTLYQREKIFTKLAQELAGQCNMRPTISLHLSIGANHLLIVSGKLSPSLHVNLFYCHSVILLTRNSFLYVLNAEIQGTRRCTCSQSHYSEGNTPMPANIFRTVTL